MVDCLTASVIYGNSVEQLYSEKNDTNCTVVDLNLLRFDMRSLHYITSKVSRIYTIMPFNTFPDPEHLFNSVEYTDGENHGSLDRHDQKTHSDVFVAK